MSKIYLFFILFLAFSCTLEKQEKKVEPDTDKKTGKEIFSERCTSCHGMDGKLGFGGAKDLTKTTKTHAEIVNQVTNGKGAMAPFKNILSIEEISSVSDYVLTLRNSKN